MGSGYFSEPLLLVLNVVFSIYTMLLILRFLLGWVQADHRNPISQAVLRATNPPLLPLRRIVPGLFGLDLACLLLIFGIKFFELFLTQNLVQGQSVLFDALLVFTVAEVLQAFLDFIFFIVLISVLMSWVAPQSYHPAAQLIEAITAPMLAPIRRFVPALGGFDFSAVILLLFIRLTGMMVIKPVVQFGGYLYASSLPVAAAAGV